MRLLTIVESHILTEGRKEDVYKKYWPEYQNLGAEYGNVESQFKELIDLFSEQDPSTNNKYLDWMVKSQLDVLRGTYPLPSEESAFDFICNLVITFHQNLTRITPEFAKQMGFPKKVVDNPRDINSYNVRDLKIMVGILKKHFNPIKNLSDADVLFENDKWLILSPKSYESACKYGAGTKWCVASKKTAEHYRSYTNRGRLVFVIDKNDKDFSPGLPYNENPMYKIAVHYQPSSNTFTIWNAPDKQIGTDLSYFFPPNIQSIITNYVTTPQEQRNWRENKKNYRTLVCRFTPKNS